jgi:hypothetical protein
MSQMRDASGKLSACSESGLPPRVHAVPTLGRVEALRFEVSASLIEARLPVLVLCFSIAKRCSGTFIQRHD